MSIKNKKLTSIITGVGLALSAGFIIGIGGWFGGGGSIPTDTMTRGLVGYWSMDEGFGDTAYDATTYQNNGTLGTTTDATTKPTWTQGKVGGALSFDGVNDYVISASNSSLTGNPDFTISVWAYIPSPLISTGSNYFPIVYWGSVSAMQSVFFSIWGEDPTKFYVGFYNGGQYASNIPVNQWIQLTYVRAGGGNAFTGNTFYLNGVSQSLTNDLTGGTPNVTAGKYFIGGENVDDRYANYGIDEVRIYNRALGAEEVRYHYNRGGPVGYWKFDEGTGQTAYNSSDNSNNGTLGATTATSTDDPIWATGKYGSALSFDGVDDYVSIPNKAYFNLPADSTLGLWFKANSVAPAYQDIISTYSVGWSLYLYPNDITFFNGSSDIMTGPVISVGIWYHVVLTRTGNSWVMYLNGIPVATGTGSTTASGNPLRISGRTGGAGNFNGLIEEVRIYNYARTPDEIALDYNAGFAAKAGGTWDFDYGQVGYWGMDEGGGQYAFDGSGNSNNGTLGANVNPGTDDPSWTTGKVGSALSFDGDDYVRVETSASLESAYYEVTMEAWIKPNDVTNEQYILSKSDGYAGCQWYLRIGGGVAMTVVVYDNTSAGYAFSKTGSLSVGVWQHVVGIFSASQGKFKIYINGVEYSSTTAAPNAGGLADRYLNIGRQGSGSYFNGLIDEVRIYSRALTAEEVRYHYNRGGPVAQWKFNEGSGLTAYDSSGNGNTGTLQNNMATTSWTSGKYGSALSFDGTDDWVSVAHSASLDSPNATQQITITAWIKPIDVANGWQRIVNKGEASPQPYLFSMTNAGYLGFWRPEGGGWTQGNTILSNNVWQFVAMTYDKSNVRFYLNGVSDGVRAEISTIASEVSVVRIGNSNTGEYFNGLIDDVRIYNYARTADEIKLDYNAGYGIYFGPGSSCEDDPGGCMTKGLVGYWGLEEGSGQYAYDLSGNSNNGTLGSTTAADVGDPAWTTGKVGGALSFDGTDDYVDAGTNSSLKVESAPFSIELWLKTGSTISNHMVLSNSQDDNAGYFLTLNRGGANNIDLGKAGVIDQTVSYTFSASTWYHIVAVQNFSGATPSFVEFFINGSSIGTYSHASAYNSSAGKSQRFGSVYGGMSYFNGLIDEVRIYNRVLSAAEIRYHYNRGGPVAYWKFDEGSGTTTYDGSGNNNTGQMVTAATSPAWVQGKYGSALSFDGINDYVNAGNGASLNITGAITIEAWIKPTANNPSYARIVERQWQTTYYLGRYSSSNNFGFIVGGNNNPWIQSSSGTWRADEWTHVVGVWDGTLSGTNIFIYVNGVVSGSGSVTVAPAGDGSSVMISSTNAYFKGTIDDVRIYNYARTPAQILQDYNAGYGVFFNARQCEKQLILDFNQIKK